MTQTEEILKLLGNGKYTGQPNNSYSAHRADFKLKKSETENKFLSELYGTNIRLPLEMLLSWEGKINVPEDEKKLYHTMAQKGYTNSGVVRCGTSGLTIGFSDPELKRIDDTIALISKYVTNPKLSLTIQTPDTQAFGIILDIFYLRNTSVQIDLNDHTGVLYNDSKDQLKAAVEKVEPLVMKNSIKYHLNND